MWYLNDMHNKYFICLFVLLLTSCCSIVPIVKPLKYYPPSVSIQLVDYIPQGTMYIGTVKVVPRGDAMLTTEKQKQRAIQQLLESAAEAGANYVVINDLQKSSKDYLFDFNFSDGYTREGEMFRAVN